MADPTSKFTSHRQAIVNRARRTGEDVLKLTSSDLVDEMKKIMAEPKSGKPMGRGMRLRSAPGEALAVETAKLFNSLAFRIIRDGGSIESHVGTNANEDGFLYPLHWELRDRKFMGPAVRAVQPVFKQRLAQLGRVKKRR